MFSRFPILREWLAYSAWLLAFLSAVPGVAQLDPFASGVLQIQGNRLTIYADEQTTDADQVINIGERARVRTCFGGSEVPCGSVQPGDPRVAGLVVRAELRGPELPQAIPMETVPGGSFVLPSLQQEGTYRLENVRLVSTETEDVLGFAEPSLAILNVHEIVVASASVRALSLQELRDRGIEFTEENFQAFDFAVGFAIDGEVVQIKFPVVYSGNGMVSTLSKPSVQLDDLPQHTLETVSRWQPPRIEPFRFEVEREGRDRLQAVPEGEEELIFPVFGAIVIPGTVTFLNQFFEAKLVVANGAPGGSDVELHDVRGTLRLPKGNVLRMAETDPPVALGQSVPVVGAGGTRVLRPGKEGMAAWTIEGLFPGTHAVRMDIEADLVRPGREPLPVLSTTQAAVEVVDARFNISFSHPDTVREGEEYTLFVTMTNLSRAAQNLVTVEIRDEHMTGAHPADPTDPMVRRIETLEPGQSETVEFELVSELTGQVIATTFQSDSQNLSGTVRLRAGVGELGIPLSPASLIMPRFTEYLKPPHTATDELVKAHVRMLGLAYSLAVAPAGMLPSGVPRVIKTDVERRAVDLAEAGQRIYLQEKLLESLEVLILDQLGNRHHLSQFDELRRRLNKGLRAGVQISELLRREQESRVLDADALFDHFGRTTSYARPYAAVLWTPQDPAARLEISRLTEQGPGRLARFGENELGSGDNEAVRTLPWAEMYRLDAGVGPDTGVASLAVVGHVALDQVFRLELVNDAGTDVRGDLRVMVPEGDTRRYREIDFGTFTVGAGQRVAVDVGASVPDPSTGFELFDLSTGTSLGVNPARSTVPLPPFRVIGARQDFRINESGPDRLGNWRRPNRYGAGLTYLFNRPPDLESGETASSYRLRGAWSGIDTAGEPASGSTEKTGTAAWLQRNSERVVNVRFDQSISALMEPDGITPLVDYEHDLDTSALVDTFGSSLDPAVPAPVLETTPLHVGGLVGGRVIRGTGEPVEGAKVTLIRPRMFFTLEGVEYKRDFGAVTTTDAEGRFFFDFIETNVSWDNAITESYVLQAIVPPGDDPELEPEESQEISSRIRLQNRMARVNIALLGRGHLTGRLVYLDDQAPAFEGEVIAASTLFNEAKTVTTEADGSFRIPGMPVGPITLTGKDGDGLRVYATVGIDRPGDTVDVHLEIQRQEAAAVGRGTVRARVLALQEDGTRQPVQGARVGCYSDANLIGIVETDAAGEAFFPDVPAGKITLQASEWSLSRTAAFGEFFLADGEHRELELLISDSDVRTVRGQVLFNDPITRTAIPIRDAVAFIENLGLVAYTDENGFYVLEGVPVQSIDDSPWEVGVVDTERALEGRVRLPRITDLSPEVVEAQTITLEQMSGSVRGVVHDPWGRPVSGAEVILMPWGKTLSGADGTFSFDDVPIGDWNLSTHIGDGLAPGPVGYIGTGSASVLFSGHSPFVTLRMRGGGVVNIKTRTATSTGILTPIYWRPTYFSDSALTVVLRGQYFETSTSELGDLQLEMPVGEFEVVAYNPFHGVREIRGEIEYPGQIVNLDILFEDAGVVFGQVVDVDGHTPVPGIPVQLHTKAFRPQTQVTDAQGRFRYELVPKGGVAVTAAGTVGTVDRVGRTAGAITLGGQELELVVQLKEQGSVKGRVMEKLNGELRPISHAQFFVRENSFPFRKIPNDGTFFTADSDGRYEMSHLYAGLVTVVARDPGQVTRRGSARGVITADWQKVTLPDIVMETSVGRLEALVRDPDTGGPVADAQVRLSNGEAATTDSQGIVIFDALKLGEYSLYAFDAPTGRSGRTSGLSLSSPGQLVKGTVFLDTRGEIRGTVFDDTERTIGVPGAIVQMQGHTIGGGFTALATTSGQPTQEGRFVFGGIPEGDFQLTAALRTSPRRAQAATALTETAPVVDIAMVLEQVGDLHFRLMESLSTGPSPVDLDQGIFSLHLVQRTRRQIFYDLTRNQPLPESDVFYFPDVLLERGAGVSARESDGEQRKGGYSLLPTEPPAGVEGTGSFDDPLQVFFRAKGTVKVTVIDANGARVPRADVDVVSVGRFPSVTNEEGEATFYAVPVGTVRASASTPLTGFGGSARGRLEFDDDVLELTVQLAPVVKARGRIFQPVPDDSWDGDPSVLVPMEGAIVELTDSTGQPQVQFTDADGYYTFEVLAEGAFALHAQDNNGTRLARASGLLTGPDGHVNPLPELILDASPPRILSIVPPPGIEDVSRGAPVEIVFSEPLDSRDLPSGTSRRDFDLVAADGTRPPGAWSNFLDAEGRQVVRFVPSEPYRNLTTYGLTIRGGRHGVHDRVGRQLTEFGDVGSNFKTSDSVGPKVLGTDPGLDRPLDPTASIRVNFNESVIATDEQLDGDLTGDAARLYGENGSGEWVSLPVVLFLTRSGYSLQVEPVQGLTIEGDTLRRRLVVEGLKDVFGNLMPKFEAEFRIYDENPPVLDAVPFPAGAPDGQLYQGATYVVLPQISNLDDLAPENPGGDVDRVDYFFSDPEDPSRPTAPGFSAVEYPFSYTFVGAYAGAGTEPQPFPLWVKVVDTSTNESEIVKVEMQVLPNSPPTVGSATATALSPVPGVFYAGSRVEAAVGGLDDVDGLQLTLAVTLRRDGSPEPIEERPGIRVTRPDGGWADLPPQTFRFDVPLDLAEGTPLFFEVEVIDSQGARDRLESERFPVADDALPPSIRDLDLRDDNGFSRVQFFIGESFRVRFRASDAETAVREVEVAFDRPDILGGPWAATRIRSDLYETEPVFVPPDVFTDATPVTVTVSATDYGDTLGESSLGFEVAPEDDPTAPDPVWLTPWDGAAWPAHHTTLLTHLPGTPFLARVKVTDLSLDETTGEEVPGNIVEVRFRGPEVDADGNVVLSDDWELVELVPGTDAPGEGVWEKLFFMPNDLPPGTELPFGVRAVDSGGKSRTRFVRMAAVTARKIYDGSQGAALADNAMQDPDGDPNGPVFLLDGAILSLFPQEDGTVRTLPEVYLYSGGEIDGGGQIVPRGSVLTAPEINSADSLILWWPFELEVERFLGVGHGSRIELSGRGLFYSNDEARIALPGETAPERWAGGSHGGSGWYGSPHRDWERDDLSAAGSVYGSVRDPYLPGGGGYAIDHRDEPKGGGVLRLFVPTGTVHLAGDLLARGIGSFDDGGGGAGGSVRLEAGRLEGPGSIDASGGIGRRPRRSGGGGGGRISLSYGELVADFDLAAQLVAEGGENHADPTHSRALAGAGTIWVEELDAATGEPLGAGRLLLANPDHVKPRIARTPIPSVGEGSLLALDDVGSTVVIDRPRLDGEPVGDELVVFAADGTELASFEILAADRVPEPSVGEERVRLHLADPASELSSLGVGAAYAGRGRLAAIYGVGSVRAVAEDPILLGPDPGVADDRSHVTTTGDARILFAGEGPTASFTVDPPEGEVLLGSSVSVEWLLEDPLGLASSTATWSLDPGSASTVDYADAPLSATQGAEPVTLEIPFDAAPGDATYSVTAVDVAGRQVTTTASWSVLPNEAPTVALSTGVTEVEAGSEVVFSVDVADREGLALVTLDAASDDTPVVESSQSAEVTGTEASLSFTVTADPRATGDVPLEMVATVLDASGAATTSAPVAVTVLPDSVPPTFELTGVEATYHAGEILSAQITTEDNVGVEEVHVTFDGVTTILTQENGDPFFTYTVEVDRAVSTARTTTLEVTAYDFIGNASETTSVPVELVPDLPAEQSVTILPDVVVLAGTTLDVTADLTDDVGLAEVEFSLSGAHADSSLRVFDAGVLSSQEIWRPTLPTTLLGGSTMELVVETTDSFGHVTTFAETITIAGDELPPEISFLFDPPSDGDVYVSGELVRITADATDNVEVTNLDLTVGDVTTSGVPPVTYTWTAPAVASTTAVSIHAEAVDPNGNVGVADRTLTVEPRVNDHPPTVRFLCPTDGALFPSAYEPTLTVNATDDEGIVEIELYRGDETTPFATAEPAEGTPLELELAATDVLPTLSGAPQTATYRAVAYDAALNSGTTEVSFQVVETVDLDPAGTNDWTALASQTAVLRSGTLELQEPRTLGGLIVLEDATMTHPPSAPSAEQMLDLTVDGPTYVACGGAISARAKGYGPDKTFPGESRPGGSGGGSHIGLGGTNPGTTYGSVYRPLENGGGGQNSNDGDRGGGVTRLRSSSLVVDGVIDADGEGPTGFWTRGGAGGSVWLAVAGEVSGGGRISARGGASEAGEQGSGGGGAIAIEYESLSGELQIEPWGGDNHRRGAAGSVLLRGPDSIYGSITLDTGPVVASQATVLPSLGSGVAADGSSGATLESGRSSIQPYFVGHWVEIFDATGGGFEGVFPITAIDGGRITLGEHLGVVPSVDEGDAWQGAYYFDALAYRGASLRVISADPIRVEGLAEIDGDIVLDGMLAGEMVLRRDARISHPTITNPGSERVLDIDLSGDLVLESGAEIDVTARGYRPDRTYPGESAARGGGGGSHMGLGGNAPGSTYGSIYRPQEAGAGGQNSGDGDFGGGVVRISARDLVFESENASIRANGQGSTGFWTRGGAGGSIWIDLEGRLVGDGLIEARGGASDDGEQGSGGGGAIAISHDGVVGSALQRLRSWGGNHFREGGAGSIYLLGPGSVFGDLTLDNGAVPNGITRLPALGTGVAADGSSGSVLETGRAAVQPYFTGHWVEIRDGSSGALEGTWRIGTVEGGRLTLEPRGGSSPTVDAGDLWQGVYRFDNYAVVGDVPVESEDPIRVSGTQEIAGEVEVREIVAGDLILRAGATLRHPPTTDPTHPESLRIELTGDLVIEDGAEIDVTGLGFAANRTYPGETTPSGGGGGSHIGRGGHRPGSTYGSVYRPQESGGGGENSGDGDRGGGVVRVTAQNLVLEGSSSAIQASGEGSTGYWTRGGAGGSIWITLGGQISGDGSIEARGGASDDGQQGSGGGGAIAVEHRGASGTVIDRLFAQGGNNHREGGVGSVYVHGPTSTFGDLLVSAGTVPDGITELPALGSGIAETGSSGGRLETGSATPIQPYFAGHWVEIYDGETLRGTWRVEAIDGEALILEPGASVNAGDQWQGVYRFDELTLLGDIDFRSADPIRVDQVQEIAGTVTTRRITGGDLVLRSGTVLTHPTTTDATRPESLEIRLAGTLHVENGAEIDVSARGFGPDRTYPGEIAPRGGGGGSHIGWGGLAPGSTYGSIYFPRESGGGGQNSGDGDRGGGVVRIDAGALVIDGAIRANGEGRSGFWTRGGAGGSVWISVDGTMTGGGLVEARGGASEDGQQGSGGGGAIALYHGGLAPELESSLLSRGGDNHRRGGAGTVYLHGPDSIFGDLVVDNGPVTGNWTLLPSLGAGVAGDASGGDILDTDLASAVQPYFTGHWVEIYDGATEDYEGVFRVSEIVGDGTELLLADAASAKPSVEPGDVWQGVYVFDHVVLSGSSLSFHSDDPVLAVESETLAGAITTREIRSGDLTLEAGTTLTHPIETGSGEGLDISLTGDLYLGIGAVIDASDRGYGPNQTHPSASRPGGGGGGSHLGRGGHSSGSTYGSVTRPWEHGGGGQNSRDGDRGGGRIRIAARDLIFADATSTIRANGQGETGHWTRGGAGGSVWIDLEGAIRGDGLVEARGGPSDNGQQGSGGGGAISITYSSADGTALDRVRAWGGHNPQVGGAGTVFFFGPDAVHGDLLVDNGDAAGAATELPSLGRGLALDGSSGDLLVTDRATPVPDYFLGHGVELASSTGVVKGVYRIVEIVGDFGVRLAGDDGSLPTVAAGDQWRGAYEFDTVLVDGSATLTSGDAVLESGVEILP